MKLTNAYKICGFLSLTLLTACGGTDETDTADPISDSRCLNEEALNERRIPVKPDNNACVIEEGVSSESITLLVREEKNTHINFRVYGNNHYVDFIQATEGIKQDVQASIEDPYQAVTVAYQWKVNPETNGEYTLNEKKTNDPDLRFSGKDVNGTYRFSLYSNIYVYNPQTNEILRQINGPTSPRFSLVLDVEELD